MLNYKNSSCFFHAIFDNSPVGFVVVNQDTSLHSINNYMFSTFNIDPKDFSERMFGNAFRCSYIYSTGKKCGEGNYCNDCNIRKILNTAIMEGKVTETIIEHNFIIDGINHNKWFKVSASRVIIDDGIFGVIFFGDITTEKENMKLLKSQLALDAATGAINKYALVSLLNDLIIRKEGLTVAMIDFDDFKSVNDRYGHLSGDRVLNLFCDTAYTNIRKQDIIARFGGEEFMLIFPGTATRIAIKALQRISTSFRTACINELGFSPTFSAGIAELSSENIIGMSVEDIITEADKKLYASKKAGKNRVTASRVSQIFK